MCGRFAQYSSGEVLEASFGASLGAQTPAPRYNIAPGSALLAVRADPLGARSFTMLHWGLIPSWAKERKFGTRTINARAETVAEKPAFRAAFRRRRCLIPADGFYEWQATPTGKQPYFITRRDRLPMAFAGLWEVWTDSATGQEIASTTILVTAANALTRPIHDRMPVILSSADAGAWLDPTQAQPAPLIALLKAFDADSMQVYPVSRRVNVPTQDDATLIEPLGE